MHTCNFRRRVTNGAKLVRQMAPARSLHDKREQEMLSSTLEVLKDPCLICRCGCPASECNSSCGQGRQLTQERLECICCQLRSSANRARGNPDESTDEVGAHWSPSCGMNNSETNFQHDPRSQQVLQPCECSSKKSLTRLLHWRRPSWDPAGGRHQKHRRHRQLQERPADPADKTAWLPSSSNDAMVSPTEANPCKQPQTSQTST